MEQERSARTKAVGIVRRLQSAGFEAYFVGGCVRDQLRGVEPTDFDVATSARPEEIEALFPRTNPVGRKFGVVIVNEDKLSLQMATFRAENKYNDGRHPGLVTFADAVTDARRRDFTINGLFYDPVAERLYDWVGGEADLRAKILRTIGEPQERFAEDHLRLLRAVRFAAQLELTVEPGTLSALKTAAPMILGVSPERIRDELLRLFRPPHAVRGLELLRETTLLGQVLPEIEATVGIDRIFPRLQL
jgi:poly(A) polymerase